MHFFVYWKILGARHFKGTVFIKQKRHFQQIKWVIPCDSQNSWVHVSAVASSSCGYPSLFRSRIQKAPFSQMEPCKTNAEKMDRICSVCIWKQSNVNGTLEKIYWLLTVNGKRFRRNHTFKTLYSSSNQHRSFQIISCHIDLPSWLNITSIMNNIVDPIDDY